MAGPPYLLRDSAYSHAGLCRNVTTILAGIKPESTLTLSEWADKYRYLSQEDSAEPGKWKTNRAEYGRGIMDAVTDPSVDEVVVQKGTQVGWTAILGNACGYYVDQDPAPILMIQPTVEISEAWSSERLAPMIRDTPVLTPKFSDPKSRESTNKVRKKEFPGGFLAIVGANAPAGLASRPIRIVMADEIDRWPLSAGLEGDPLKLASKRQETFWNRKTLKGSSPTFKSISVIEREYKRSDMRIFHVPCPHCDEAQPLRWEQVKWDKLDGEHSPETAHYCCEHCGTLWTDAERHNAVSQGHWVATAPFRGIAGFHISQLYSPWVPLEKVVREFLEAKGNPELMQVWVNTVLGDTFEDDADRVDEHALMARTKNWDGECPNEVVAITCGVDVQDDRFEIERVGWGMDEESWSLGYDVIYGDPSAPQMWKTLDEYIAEKTVRVDGTQLSVNATCLDTGGHYTDATYKYCKDRWPNHPTLGWIMGIKGSSDLKSPIWPKHATKNNKGKISNLFVIGVHAAKDMVYRRLNVPTPGPGYCWFPKGRETVFFEQLTAEVVQTKYTYGRPYRIYVCPPGKRNEALDCRVYAYAAMRYLNIRWAVQTAKYPPLTTSPKPDAPDKKSGVSDSKAPRRRTTRSNWM